MNPRPEKTRTPSTQSAAIHASLNRRYPKVGACEECHKEGKTDYAFQRHPEPPTRNREDYRELCRSCHLRTEGRQRGPGRGPAGLAGYYRQGNYRKKGYEVTRYVTEEPDPRERFVLYRLCDCIACEGTGKEPDGPMGIPVKRCPTCRGEGRVRQELATCESPEAVGVALVTLAREGEFEECPVGLLDRMPACETCGGSGDDLNPLEGVMVECFKCKGSGVKPTGTWLVLPWLPSPRNASDAGKLLRSKRK